MATLSGYCTFEEANGCRYTVHFTGAVTTAKTLIQIKAGAAMPLDIVEIAVDGQSDTADAMEILGLRKTAAATVTDFTPLEEMEAGPAAAAAGGSSNQTGTMASGEGTDGDILIRRDASVQAGGGFFWSRNMGNRKIHVPAGGFFAVKSNITIT